MIAYTLLLLVVAQALAALCLPLARNIRIARSTGLRYVVVPYYIYNTSWPLILLRKPFVKLLNLICGRPNPSPASWQRLVLAQWPLRFRHAPFTLLGTDSFLTVAPGGIVLNTSDAELITQILSRPSDFPKPTHIYQGISIYGPNLFASEGPTWRRHLKLVSPAFSDKTYKLVWRETLSQSQAMLESWVESSLSGKSIRHVACDTMRLSLAIIGRAGFGQQTEWWSPREDNNNIDDEDLPASHSVTFYDAFQYIAFNVFKLVAVLSLPTHIGRQWFPLSWRKALEAYEIFGSYMTEMIAKKRQTSDSKANQSSSVDLLSQLVRESEEGSSILSDNEILGNLFFFIVAGHETTASSLHMSILLLALHPRTQRQVQEDLAEIFDSRPPSQWSYEHHLPRLFNGTLYTVLLEELRLVSPILTIPKLVSSTPQEVMINGRQTLLPASITIRLCLSAVHVNPRFWPHDLPTDPENPIFPLDNVDNDLEEFKPQRWMRPKAEPIPCMVRETDISSTKGRDIGEASTIQPNTLEADAAAHPKLYTPVKGSFIPFGEGQRSCIGRRFAQVEILATLAVIFSQYSVELAVGEWASDKEVSEMTTEQKAQIWNKAADAARLAWKDKLVSGITVKLSGDAQVPFRFVKKGEERFLDLY